MRVLRAADFSRGLREGARTSDARLTVWAIENGLPHPRLGLLVGKRNGNAPTRNLLKRRLREAFRTAQHELPPGLDLLVRVRWGKVPETARCRQSLLALARRLSERFPRKAP
ncbi:MAG: ribonuclease P protein component [Phycisphaerae bacterium]